MNANLIIANIISNTFNLVQTSQRGIRSRARVVARFHRYRDSANSTRLKLTSSPREPYSQGYNGQVCQRCILFNLSKTKLAWRRPIPSDVSGAIRHRPLRGFNSFNWTNPSLETGNIIIICQRELRVIYLHEHFCSGIK